MFIFQVLQTFFALSYPLLHYICKDENYEKEISLRAFFCFLAITVISLLSYGIDHFSTRIISIGFKKFLRFIKMAILFPSSIIIFFALLHMQASDWKYRVLVMIGCVLNFIISILASDLIERYGLKEVLFAIILIPVYFLSSNMILFNELNFNNLMEFGPINFLFLGTLLCYGSQKKIIQDNEKGGIWSLTKLLGKQDSFRTLFIIITYCYLHAVIVAFHQLSTK